MATRVDDFKVLHVPDITLPKKIDLRAWMSAVENQQDLGSCTANAFGGVLEYIINRKYRKNVDVSRLFIYYNARRLAEEDRTIRDTGATLYHSADALRRYGDCEEEYWPYQTGLVNQKPSQEAYDKAREYTVIPVKMPFEVKTFKKSLAMGHPVVVGVILLKSAGTEARMNSGRIERPDPNQTAVRNTQWHAVVCVGYDDESRHFIVRNSWGKDWGLRGYFHLPYEYFDDNRLADEQNGAWTIHDILYRTSHLPTMIYAKGVKKEQHRTSQHKPQQASNFYAYRRPTPVLYAPRYGAGQVSPYYNIYHRR